MSSKRLPDVTSFAGVEETFPAVATQKLPDKEAEDNLPETMNVKGVCWSATQRADGDKQVVCTQTGEKFDGSQAHPKVWLRRDTNPDLLSPTTIEVAYADFKDVSALRTWLEEIGGSSR